MCQARRDQPVLRDHPAKTACHHHPNFVLSDLRWRNGLAKPAMCAADEVMVSATCLSKIGSVNEAPKTIGDSGAICDPQSGQTETPEAVILCAKR